MAKDGESAAVIDLIPPRECYACFDFERAGPRNCVVCDRPIGNRLQVNNRPAMNPSWWMTTAQQESETSQ